MKRVLWFDSIGGASGDMILASLIDLGVRPADLNDPLASLGDMHIAIEAHRHSAHGLHGTRIEIHAHEGHEAHDHGHGHGPHHAHAHSHSPHRTLPEITRMIERSALSTAVKQRSLAVFRRLAQAEGRVHDKPPEDIHFHEVGALDSIADIVGACLALEGLEVDGIGFSPLPQGYGTITCAHGILPNPPPATVELLKGVPVTHADEPFELVTPTGAALLTTWRSLDRWPDGWILKAVGHGFGQRTLNRRPNLLRATLFDAPPADVTEPDLCLVLETNIDDTTPELVGSLVQKLLAAGAYDAYTAPIQMKKQRPGILLTVLCAPNRKAAMLDMIFTESTTFGVREHLTRRTMLEREWVPVTTRHGTLRIKLGRWHGAPVTASPEYEDCVKAAEASGASLREVYECALARGRGLLG
jgi:uncharacterized protein (TIGR00299 family) protein